MNKHSRMTITGWVSTLCVALFANSCSAVNQYAGDPVVTDPLKVDSLAPATSVELELPSSGSRMNGLLYLASGEGPHPTVILLHGFPGNERNLDIAQAIRRSGMNALFFSYRGAWGSGGDFSFSHALEDVAAVIQKLRVDGGEGKYRIDPRRIALIGHSLGGWVSLMGAINDSSITCAGALDFWNIGADGRTVKTDAPSDSAFMTYANWLSAPGAPLHVAGPRTLIDEMAAHGTSWDVDSLASRLKSRSVLVISTNANPSHETLVRALEHAGSRKITQFVWDTDHLFSARRIELAKTVVDWLHKGCGF